MVVLHGDVKEKNRACLFRFALFFVLELILIRSDSELHIFTPRSEKRIGLLMQSDTAKSDRIKSHLRI